MTEFVENREVSLESNDGETFRVSYAVATLSKFVKASVEEDETETPNVPIPKVNAADLARVIEFCTHYLEEPMTPIEKPLKSADLKELVQPWYIEFVEKTNNETLCSLTVAANFLDIRPLLDLCCARIASFIKGRSPEELRQNLDALDQFTR